MFNLFKKRAPKFGDLSPAQRANVTRRMLTGVRAFGDAAGKYKIVSGLDQMLREQGRIERGNESDILDPHKRGKLLNLARNQVRNSSTFNSILKQFELNAVGTVGGKALFALPDISRAHACREAFANWTTSAEFYDGLRFADLLKLLLRTYLVGGECVMLFDDGLVEDSGKIMLFEPDEIGNMSGAQFLARFGRGFRQVQGHIKNANGRTVGVIVSKAERGQIEFNAANCYVLSRAADAGELDSLWINPRNMWRKDQIVGTPPVAASLATIIDLEDLANYELQAAKKNSQTLAQVIQEQSKEAAPLPSAFGADTDFSSMTDSEIAAAAEAEGDAAEEHVSLEQIKGAGAIYEVMPEGSKLELLDTKHPNESMPEFIRWLAGRAAAPFGLGSVYATLKADSSYTAFRGEQVMSWPAFEEAQKFLERVCDWAVVRWAKWAARKGALDATLAGEVSPRVVKWMWPKMREVNQVDEQNAISLKLKNGTATYEDLLGPDWLETLEKQAAEHEILTRLGLPHPRFETASGQIIGSAETASGGNGETNEK